MLAASAPTCHNPVPEIVFALGKALPTAMVNFAGVDVVPTPRLPRTFKSVIVAELMKALVCNSLIL